MEILANKHLNCGHAVSGLAPKFFLELIKCSKPSKHNELQVHVLDSITCCLQYMNEIVKTVDTGLVFCLAFEECQNCAPSTSRILCE